MSTEICPECKAVEPEQRNPIPNSVAVKHGGTLHHSDCPRVAFMQPSSEERARFNAFVDDVKRCQRAAAAAAHTYVIGGV